MQLLCVKAECNLSASARSSKCVTRVAACVLLEGTLSVNVIAHGNGISDPRSNSEQGC